MRGSPVRVRPVAQKRTPVLFFYRTVLSPMVLRRYALSIIALAILESGQWLKRELRFSFFIEPSSHLWFSAAMLCRLLLWQFSSPASDSKQKKRHPCEVNPKSFCLTFGVHFNIEDFKQALKQYIRYYNYDRIKLKLKMSPVKYRTHFQNIVN